VLKTIRSAEVAFSEATFAEPAEFRKARFEGNADFWRCTFVNRVDFDEAQFSYHTNFSPTRFHSIAYFRDASFRSVTFGGATFADEAFFSWCRFGHTRFGATFKKKVSFFSATFENVTYFSWAEFFTIAEFRLATFCSDVLFGSTTFAGEADFWGTTFRDSVVFSAEHGRGGFANDSSCDFQHARFDRPERVSFHTVTLRRHWFLNVDPRRFELIAVRWPVIASARLIEMEIAELIRKKELEEREELRRNAERRRNAEMEGDEWAKQEMEEEEAFATLQDKSNLIERKASFHDLLSITCRQLAANAEENHRYDEATDFRFWSMELRRKRGRQEHGRLSVRILHTLYRYLSGYGEQIGRALGMLVALWLVFGLLYTRVGFVRAPASSSSAPRNGRRGWDTSQTD